VLAAGKGWVLAVLAMLAPEAGRCARLRSRRQAAPPLPSAAHRAVTEVSGRRASRHNDAPRGPAGPGVEQRADRKGSGPPDSLPPSSPATGMGRNAAREAAGAASDVGRWFSSSGRSEMPVWISERPGPSLSESALAGTDASSWRERRPKRRPSVGETQDRRWPAVGHPLEGRWGGKESMYNCTAGAGQAEPNPRCSAPCPALSGVTSRFAQNCTRSREPRWIRGLHKPPRLLLGSGVVRPGQGSWAARLWCASKSGSS
jgi:hypothetical protein